MKKATIVLTIILMFVGVSVYAVGTENNNQTTNKIDISYNDLSTTQKMDILYPDNPTKSNPVVIFLHGGSYVRGDKTTYQDNVCSLLNSNGYICIMMNYRLTGEMKFPGAVDDVKTAIRYLKVYSESFAINKDKIFIMGHSAGANLGSMVVSTSGTEALGNEEIRYNEVNSNVAGFIGIAGFYDLNGFFANSNKRSNENSITRIKGYYGESANLKNRLIKENNSNYIKNLRVPTFLIHGCQDKIVDYQETINYYNEVKVKTSNYDISYELFQNGTHGLKDYTIPIQNNTLIEWLNNH
ncbi:alpha/beta hydrolase [Erysipelotrichaceae bacterium OttesenSCG-928-M19]|nr:alpha/beta hydrolase [Erysipelotrichaceae bacterium OttesenSCG-928-M19]